MTRPSMLELVEELEGGGHVERRPDESDRRANLICLTRDGRRVHAQALRAVRRIESIYADEVRWAPLVAGRRPGTGLS